MRWFSPPAPLAERHDLDRFDNGRASVLDKWLKERSRPSEGLSARTYVVCPESAPDRVVGYVTLAAGQARLAALSSAKLRRNMPDPVPALLIGRLAVDKDFSGRGVATGLLKEAWRLSHEVSQRVGVRALFVHAIDDDAARFYRARGFIDSPEAKGVLFMSIERIATLRFDRL